jgi:hypothetical protein
MHIAHLCSFLCKFSRQVSLLIGKYFLQILIFRGLSSNQIFSIQFACSLSGLLLDLPDATAPDYIVETLFITLQGSTLCWFVTHATPGHNSSNL